MGRGFWMALIGGDPAATSTASQKQPGISQPGGAGHHGDIASTTLAAAMGALDRILPR